jgi:uncharacterized protein (TIGR03083 family)
MSDTNAEQLDLIEQTISSIDELLPQIADEAWDAPTDLAGWSVKDNLSHLCHYEATAIGRPTPDDIDVSHNAHVTNDFQRINERGVEARRARAGREVVEEFREVTAQRLKILRNLEDWDAPVTLPAGEFKEGDILAIRTMDLYYHEQDMRRATRIPGHLSGDVARFAFGRLSSGMGYVVGKVAAAPEGTRVRFEIGDPGRTFDVVVRDGRGIVEDPDGDPNATLSGDFETFLCLAGGRWTAQRATDNGRWTATGDPGLITKIHEGMSVIP